METGDHAAARPQPPRLGLVVLTCMDARVEPARLFGFGHGDAHVLRNAGGVVTEDVLRSLALSHHLLETRELRIVAHTGCGVVGRTNAELRAAVGPAAAGVDFRPHADEESLVRESIRAVRESPLLPDWFATSGFVYDVDADELRPVTP